MHKAALLFIVLVCTLAPAREGAVAPHGIPAKVGVVLIGAAQDGLALAADGSSLNADGRVSQEQKLFQLGNQGSLALIGTVSIQDPIGGRVRGELNVARIAGKWLADHPDVDVKTGNRDVNSAISAELNKFLSTRDPGAKRGAFKFGVIAAGFQDGKPVILTTEYFVSGVKDKTAHTEQTVIAPLAGSLLISGDSAAPMQVLSGKAITLKAFTNEPAVARFKAAKKASLSAQDYINLFDVMLRAAESAEGRKLDGSRAIVAAPNRFAEIKTKSGFAWSRADAADAKQ